MKQDILKIAGVKDEKSFYKKFPSEEAFMKVHGKEFKKAKMGTAMVKKQLTQLTDFANPPQAQAGIQQFGLQKPNFNYNVAAANEQMFGGYDFNKGLVDQYVPQVRPGEFANRTRNEVSASAYDTTGVPKYTNSIGKSQTPETPKDPSMFSSVLNNAGDIYGGIQQVGKDTENLRKARQFSELSKVGLLATQSRPERIKNKYVRPEDMEFDPNQMSPSYGTNANVLAKDGKKVRGNKTEIQNTYAPGSLYDNLGYEPLYDSAQNGGFFGNWQGDVKDFGEANAGGFGTMLGGAIVGGNGAPSGASKIGGGIGSIAGNAIGGPLGGVIGKGLGSLAGGIIGGAQQRSTEKFNKLGMENVKQAAFQSGMQGMQQNQFGAFMEDGGEVGLKYLSHDWQPQTITKFGEYNVKDLLREDPTMDTLRSGGHLKNYAPLSERAMSTERFAMGGELQTHWGGEAEPISYNPYLPDGGETVMFRGQSHEEADGQGRTGIGVTYGENPVEVERGEPAVKLKDGGEQESLVVYGNMKIPSYGVSELGKDAKNKKFKNYVKDISRLEAKQNKIVEKGTKLIDNSDPNDIYELLTANSGKAMVMGGNMKQKTYANKKILASGIQNAILHTAEEMGVESDALSRGIIKQDKNSNVAKMGGKFTQAQAGIQTPPVNPALRMINPMFASKPAFIPPSRVPVDQMFPSPMDESGNYYMPGYQPYGEEAPMDTEAEMPQDDLETSEQVNPYNFLTSFLQNENARNPLAKKLGKMDEKLKNKKEGRERGKTTLADVFKGARTLLPYLRGTNQEAIDPNQFSGEMLALATNQLQPVQAQQYTPQLETPYSISFQDQMNANQADFNAMERQYGYNPAAASQLAAQKYAANSSVLGQQARANQEMQMGAYNRNRGVLNDATIKNLAILDNQYQRQEQAKSNTKMQAQVALNSIASKLAQHKLENRKLGIQENMYNYRFGPNGRAINENAPYEFDMEGSGNYAKGGMPTLPEGFEYKTTIQEKKKAKETARNGSIVKAIKNL